MAFAMDRTPSRMRIVKVVTLALTAVLSLHLSGCASETTSDEPGPSETVASPEPKQTLSAPLPATTDATNDATTDAVDPTGAGGALGATGAADDDDDVSTPTTTPSPTTTLAPTTNTPKSPPPSDPGPAPAGTCSVTKDSLGFFARNSGKSDYVAYVPASYDKKKPMRLIVGLHGCGDNALNFAKWAVNPWDTRAAQQHIGISVGGETGGSKCWNIGGDDDKVMAAVEDIAKCFWVDRSKIVVGGYSSGGQLAYRVGLKQADKFAGILIENSGLYAAGDTPAKLTANAAWKINIAHSAHTGDSVFPIAKVQADWSTITSAGLPLRSQAVAGTHDGDGKEWASWLIPASAGWTKPSK